MSEQTEQTEQTKEQVKDQVKENLKLLYKPNSANVVVIGFWLIMIIGNVMGTGLAWTEEVTGGMVVSMLAYLIAFSLSGILAGQAVGKFILNRRWNSAINEVINNDTLGGRPIEELLAELK